MRQIFILLGPPGSGNGSVGSELSRILKIPLISSGNILRENVKSNTLLGGKAKKYMDLGELVPDEVVIKMIEERIKKESYDKGFILDGFPRTLIQAEMLDMLILKTDDVKVFYLQAGDNFLVNRLSNRRVCEKCEKIYHLINHPPKEEGVCDVCGGKLIQRKDDAEEVIRKRLEVDKILSASLLDFYKKKGLLHIIAGDVNLEYMMNEAKKIVKW
jgi:adenylate kinase